MEQDHQGVVGAHLEALVCIVPEKEDWCPVLTWVKPWEGVTTEPPDRSMGIGCTQDVHRAGGAQIRNDCMGMKSLSIRFPWPSVVGKMIL